MVFKEEADMEHPPTEPTAETEVKEVRAPVEDQALLDALLLEDVLIEDISIDGMCGVY
jgi:mycofactocin precursor